ncbi:MAG: hypothetical protein DWQ05_17155 [Calditrichaeota bacterium]|nr:MAG: hypothetical protein DWQ05_17155 [Calditrichota bacterium]
MKFFTITIFVACLLIWALFKWLTPDYPLNETEMIAIVAVVAIFAFIIKRIQLKISRKKDTK